MRNLLPRLGFIDETSLKTNMTKTSGWSPRRAHPIDHALFDLYVVDGHPIVALTQS
jgi:hypothetical protein